MQKVGSENDGTTYHPMRGHLHLKQENCHQCKRQHCGSVHLIRERCLKYNNIQFVYTEEVKNHSNRIFFDFYNFFLVVN